MSERISKDLMGMPSPPRPLLPDNVTVDELWWLYHNHSLFHSFVERIIAEAELNWQRHHKWEGAR
jgi:hypothetical protein